MKKIIRFIFIASCCLVGVFSGLGFTNVSNYVYLGGFAAGFSVSTKGAEIIGVCDVLTNNGQASPSNDAVIKAGDIIISISGIETNNAEDVKNAIKDGKEKTVIIERNGEFIEKKVLPALDVNGEYKLGVFIRDKINGIGTITYIKGDKFASLGHPIIRDNGTLLSVKSGEIFDCNITGAIKGVRGRAGELKGVFSGKNVIGSVYKNALTGVYGYVSDTFKPEKLTKIDIGTAVIGDASVYSTVDEDGVKEYKISIVKVDGENRANKNYVVKIKDQYLIEKTGGIVQGMSGSPIVQNGKIVGAITHVFINDPTRGFAVSIKNMLENE